MGAFSEVYVDPSIDADSGAGTEGSPYGDLNYAIGAMTFDTSNGTRINIKSGAAEVLTESLNTSVASAGITATVGAPLKFEGYDSSAGDGGQAEVSGGGSYSIFDNVAFDYLHFKNLYLHDVGFNHNLLRLRDYCSVVNCRLAPEHSGSGYVVYIRQYGHVVRNRIENGCAYGIDVIGNYSIVAFNTLFDGDDSISTLCMRANNATGTVFYRNIIKLESGSAAEGIYLDFGISAIGNSIYAIAGTGRGIFGESTSVVPNAILNNLVEGFSGSGGVGIDLATLRPLMYGGNSVYNCTTNYSSLYDKLVCDLGGSETLTASPFSDPSSNDFSPVDTGSVAQGHVPNSFLT